MNIGCSGEFITLMAVVEFITLVAVVGFITLVVVVGFITLAGFITLIWWQWWLFIAVAVVGFIVLAAESWWHSLHWLQYPGGIHSIGGSGGRSCGDSPYHSNS